MDCLQCHYNNPEAARFCNQCAAPLSVAAPTTPEAAPPTNYYTEGMIDHKSLAQWWAKRDGGQKVVIVAFALLAPILLIIALQSSSSSPDSSKDSGMAAFYQPDEKRQEPIARPGPLKTAPTPSAAEEKMPAAKPLTEFESRHQETIAALREVNPQITYAHIKKNADRYSGQNWAFTGKVLEIQESGNYTIARIGIGAYGMDAIWIEAPFTTDFIEQKKVFVVGEIRGMKSYTSQAGWEITIPEIRAIAITTPAEGNKIKSLAKMR